MAADHSELVEEMDEVAALPIEDRLLLAKNRRLEQIKGYCSRSDELQKGADGMGSKRKSGGVGGGRDRGKQPHEQGKDERQQLRIGPDGRERQTKRLSKRNITFTDDVTLFEAASRNDIDEG